MLQFITSHWLQIGAVGAALSTVISELMPFLPSKYNGIAHAVIGILGKKAK